MQHATAPTAPTAPTAHTAHTLRASPPPRLLLRVRREEDQVHQPVAVHVRQADLARAHGQLETQRRAAPRTPGMAPIPAVALPTVAVAVAGLAQPDAQLARLVGHRGSAQSVWRPTNSRGLSIAERSPARLVRTAGLGRALA